MERNRMEKLQRGLTGGGGGIGIRCGSHGR